MAPIKKMQTLLRRGTAFLTPTSSTNSVHKTSSGTDFCTAAEKDLFPHVNKEVDGDDCDHDCESCSVHYPSKFSINESDKLYGRVNGWSTHLLVATGKTDWVRDVEDEKGSIMEAVGKAKQPSNGKLMLSASNIPLPDDHSDYAEGSRPTTVLLLPAFQFIDRTKPSDVPELLRSIISSAPTTTTPIVSNEKSLTGPLTPVESSVESNEDVGTPNKFAGEQLAEDTAPTAQFTPTLNTDFSVRPCNHRALILLCSQRTRDARCGQSAPLLRREFERHLRPLGLYRDLQDERPGGVGIYFISHVGGHKYSANVMVYRRKQNEDGTWGEGTQGIWLARVRPEECEQIVKFTVLQGKVVKPATQLRGGFDREKGLISW